MDENIYLFYINCLKKQLKMRNTISQILTLTINTKYINYLRPYAERRNFSLTKSGFQLSGLPFEIYCYWRNFYNWEYDKMDYETW